MGTHWMQAGGIFPKIMDEYMNALPDQPQRKLRDPDSALEVVQILMLFIVWGVGTAAAIIAFTKKIYLQLLAVGYAPVPSITNGFCITKCQDLSISEALLERHIQ